LHRLEISGIFWILSGIFLLILGVIFLLFQTMFGPVGSLAIISTKVLEKGASVVHGKVFREDEVAVVVLLLEVVVKVTVNALGVLLVTVNALGVLLDITVLSSDIFERSNVFQIFRAIGVAPIGRRCACCGDLLLERGLSWRHSRLRILNLLC
jgi:hypothetical protein